MRKKVTSLLLVFVMILSMMVTAVPSYAASVVSAPDTLVITSNETEAYPGDEITYTVSIGPVTNLAGIEFQLVAPAGLTLKEGSLVDGLQTKLGVAMCGFNPANAKVLIVGGMNYTSTENTDILTVTYTVDANFTGELVLGVNADTCMFIDPANNLINMTILNAGSKVTVVEKPVFASGISLNMSALSLKIGEAEKLTATLTPAVNNDSVVWSSSNNSVATVAADGTVTAVSMGSAVITAKAKNVSATCNVTVACNHKDVTEIKAVASTCTVQGNGAYTVCNTCEEIISGSAEKLPLDKTNHVKTTTVDAVIGTCINPGHAEYVVCDSCKVILSGSDVDVAGPHGPYVDKAEDKYLKSAADCENATVYYKSCELCGVASETETFTVGDPLGHNYSNEWNKGDDGHWHECAECGDKKDFVKHSYVDGVCDVCNYEDTHKHVLTLVGAIEPTCVDAGRNAYYSCSDCDEWFEDAQGTVKVIDKAAIKIPATGHDWADATCTDAKTCTVCGITQGNALGHKWTVATCTTAKTCKVCGAKQGNALGHNWAKATCTTAKTCTVCGETQGKALGHTWADATCTTAKTCKACGVTQGKALGHKWADATCTTAKTCTACGETQGKALGHKFGKWVTVKEATVNAEGKEERVCSVCKVKESRVIEKAAYLLGDADMNGKITAADARIILRVASRLDKIESYNISVEVIDLDFNGKVTAADARIDLRVASRLEDLPKK